MHTHLVCNGAFCDSVALDRLPYVVHEVPAFRIIAAASDSVQVPDHSCPAPIYASLTACLCPHCKAMSLYSHHSRTLQRQPEPCLDQPS
jgi:hypothetical protein